MIFAVQSQYSSVMMKDTHHIIEKKKLLDKEIQQRRPKVSDKQVNQESNRPKNLEQGSGSSNTGDIHRSISILSGHDKSPHHHKE